MLKPRRRNAAQWAELIREYSHGEETEEVFCQRHGVNFNTFRKWKYRQRSATPRPTSSTPSSSFVEVVPALVAPAPPRGSEPVRICLGDEMSIECPSSLEIEVVARLVGALRHGR